jgi:hypothetical protein
MVPTCIDVAWSGLRFVPRFTCDEVWTHIIGQEKFVRFNLQASISQGSNTARLTTLLRLNDTTTQPAPTSRAGDPDKSVHHRELL